MSGVRVAEDWQAALDARPVSLPVSRLFQKMVCGLRNIGCALEAKQTRNRALLPGSLS